MTLKQLLSDVQAELDSIQCVVVLEVDGSAKIHAKSHADKVIARHECARRGIKVLL